jgi:hypothetical protein
MLPVPNAANTPIGKLLERALFALLEARHPGWADEEGSTGCIELRWLPREGGAPETQVGGTIGYRSLITHTYEFWSANGELTLWE